MDDFKWDARVKKVHDTFKWEDAEKDIEPMGNKCTSSTGILYQIGCDYTSLLMEMISPGILKTPVDEAVLSQSVTNLPQPRFSNLSAKQHAQYLKYSEKYKDVIRPVLKSMGERRCFSDYKAFLITVTDEQREYAQYAFQNALHHINVYDNVYPVAEDHFKKYLEHEKKRLESYLQNYVYHLDFAIYTIPYTTDPQLKFVDLCVSKGNLPTILSPNAGTEIPVYVPKNHKELPKKPISKDEVAAKLAAAWKADIVISLSSLKTLANNFLPYPCEWEMPMVVKEIDDNDGNTRSVAFLDKALPPKSVNGKEKSIKYFKKAVKHFLRDLTALPNKVPAISSEIISTTISTGDEGREGSEESRNEEREDLEKSTSDLDSEKLIDDSQSTQNTSNELSDSDVIPQVDGAGDEDPKAGASSATLTRRKTRVSSVPDSLARVADMNVWRRSFNDSARMAVKRKTSSTKPLRSFASFCETKAKKSATSSEQADKEECQTLSFSCHKPVSPQKNDDSTKAADNENIDDTLKDDDNDDENIDDTLKDDDDDDESDDAALMIDTERDVESMEFAKNVLPDPKNLDEEITDVLSSSTPGESKIITAAPQSPAHSGASIGSSTPPTLRRSSRTASITKSDKTKAQPQAKRRTRQSSSSVSNDSVSSSSLPVNAALRRSSESSDHSTITEHVLEEPYKRRLRSSDKNDINEKKRTWSETVGSDSSNDEVVGKNADTKESSDKSAEVRNSKRHKRQHLEEMKNTAKEGKSKMTVFSTSENANKTFAGKIIEKSVIATATVPIKPSAGNLTSARAVKGEPAKSNKPIQHAVSIASKEKSSEPASQGKSSATATDEEVLEENDILGQILGMQRGRRERDKTTDTFKSKKERAKRRTIPSPVQPNEDKADGIHNLENIDFSGEADGVFYNLWSNGKVRLLVRGCTHGKIFHRNDSKQKKLKAVKERQLMNVTIRTKLEYQPDLGFEQLSVAEACTEWLDLQFRPQPSSVLRCRVDPVTHKLILADAVKDVPGTYRHYEAAGFSHLAANKLLSKVFQKLMDKASFDPNSYLLSHKSGESVIVVRRAIGEPSAKAVVYELSREYANPGRFVFCTPQSLPWNPPDPKKQTSRQRKLQRIPMTFEINPETKHNKGKKSKKSKSKKKKNKKSNIDV